MEESLRGDLRWRTIPGLLAATASSFGDRMAVVDEDRELTFAELEAEAHRFARALIAAGVDRGDRVAVWAPNKWRWIVAALGTHLAGGTLVPVNTRYKGVEAGYILTETRPKVLVMMGSFLGTDYPRLLSEAGFSPPSPCITVMMDDDTSSTGESFSDFCARGGDVSEDSVAGRVAALESTDYSDILFTSGTTGLPKGVLTDHGQNLRGFYDWSSLAGMRAGDRYAIIPPFFHAFGYKAGWLSALMHGMTMYPHAALDVAHLLEQIATRRITLLPGPPALFHSLLEHPERDAYDLSSLRLAIIGAAAIPPILIRRMKDELGFDRITTCYGLTEATALATVSREDDPLEAVVTTVGRAIPDVELRVAREGEPPSEIGEGEVVIRGYNVLRGYFGSEAKPVDDDGWLLTGDVGVLDEAGYLRITDRKKDMFIVGGFNAYPAEIEKAMTEHPGIDQVAVVGVPDERLGEVGMAFVIPRDEGLTGESVIAWTGERLANYKVPRYVVFLSEFPRNATGKVLKHELRAIARERVEVGGAPEPA